LKTVISKKNIVLTSYF